MSTLARAADDAAAVGLALDRAQPRGEGRLLLALRTPEGGEVAGQWHADPARSAAVARETRAHSSADDTRHTGHLLVQRRGADRRLPTLHRLVLGGATLVAHRPERRGVVRHPDGRYTKVVPGSRVEALTGTLGVAAGWPGVQVPRVLATGTDAVTLGPLPGRTLHDLLAAADTDLTGAGRVVGEALARLHAVDVPVGLGAHTLEDELAVAERWLDLAATHAGLPLDVEAALRPARRRVAAHRGRGTAVLHRDLHDKQLLLEGDRVGLLDLDLLAAGEPALDLANLLVHLELRARQGRLTGRRAREVADAVLEGYRPDPDVLAGLPLYARLTRLRLAGVYAFRPRSAAAAWHLSTDPLLEELS